MSADSVLERAIVDLPMHGTRLVLDVGGDPIAAVDLVVPVTIAVGPEGGIEPQERATLHAAGFRSVSLGATILRFETAAVAALAIVRSSLAASSDKTEPERTDG